MNTNTHSAFLKEMGITQWTSRDAVGTAFVADSQSENSVEGRSASQIPATVESRAPNGMWWFIGSKPQGDSEQLMQNIIRALGLSAQEWSWKNLNEPIDPEHLPHDGMPIVAIALGGSVAQKLSGERDALPQLRQTILAMSDEGLEELPLIATFDLSHLLSRPKDKALFWQDILLAKSVLQNL